jgi:hypothetical protein
MAEVFFAVCAAFKRGLATAFLATMGAFAATFGAGAGRGVGSNSTICGPRQSHRAGTHAGLTHTKQEDEVGTAHGVDRALAVQPEERIEALLAYSGARNLLHLSPSFLNRPGSTVSGSMVLAVEGARVGRTAAGEDAVCALGVPDRTLGTLGHIDTSTDPGRAARRDLDAGLAR